MVLEARVGRVLASDIEKKLTLGPNLRDGGVAYIKPAKISLNDNNSWGAPRENFLQFDRINLEDPTAI